MPHVLWIFSNTQVKAVTISSYSFSSVALHHHSSCIIKKYEPVCHHIKLKLPQQFEFKSFSIRYVIHFKKFSNGSEVFFSLCRHLIDPCGYFFATLLLPSHLSYIFIFFYAVLLRTSISICIVFYSALTKIPLAVVIFL
jgi:hypothetical protein